MKRPYTINLLIWGFQQHFQHSVQYYAEELCKSLDKDLNVETFLVGLRKNGDETKHPVCVEPEECGYSPRDFANVREKAEHYRAIDPRSGLLHTAASAQDAHDHRVANKALRNAILEIAKGRSRLPNVEYYCSYVMSVAGYDVAIVLRLEYKGEQKPYELPKVHAEEQYGARHSLIEAAVEKFLARCSSKLDSLDPRLVADFTVDIEELLRNAADHLMETPVLAAKNIEGLYGLYTSCNHISSLKYEGAEGSGNMLISKVGHKNIAPALLLREPVRLTNYRAVRKLLEVSTSGDSLLCDGCYVYGLGKQEGLYNQAEADLFEIRFIKHYTWELVHGGHRMMKAAYGNPTLPSAILDEPKFRSDLRRIFEGISSRDVERLLALANQACEQKHGALLIISASAEKESARLSNQCTRVEPFELTPTILRQVSSIDGAVLLNQHGTCFAIGAILDGLAIPEGDSSRGARFNSSLRYLAAKKQCVALIVSEDGSAEWVPNLIPQIRKSKLKEMRNEVNNLLLLQSMDDKRHRKILDSLAANRFYLDSELCENGNQLAARLDAYLISEELMRVTYPKFETNPDMSESYLLND